MVTGKYSITFTDEKAPKINCKYSEVNREIIFTPDVEVSDSYSVELVIVKPDSTFTVSTGTILETGEIVVTIPSQATVVKGVGQYLIRIFDNTTNIYSSYGDIWVDDNLLTDDIIESVAEFNGYVFPDDFALKTEIPEIDDTETVSDKTWSSEKISNEIASSIPSADSFIDDDDVLYDKTWSSEKISYELGNVQGFHVFTTTEQPYGRWIDGSMIYEKTYDITINCPANTRTDILTLTDQNIISLEGRAYYPSNSMWYMSPYDMNINQSNNNKMVICTHQSGGHPVITLVNGGFSNAFSKVQFTIRYTKNA